MTHSNHKFISAEIQAFRDRASTIKRRRKYFIILYNRLIKLEKQRDRDLNTIKFYHSIDLTSFSEFFVCLFFVFFFLFVVVVFVIRMADINTEIVLE